MKETSFEGLFMMLENLVGAAHNARFDTVDEASRLFDDLADDAAAVAKYADQLREDMINVVEGI